MFGPDLSEMLNALSRTSMEMRVFEAQRSAALSAYEAELRQYEEMVRQMPRVDAGPSLPIIPRKRKD